MALTPCPEISSTSVALGEAYPAGGQAVDVGSIEQLLPIAAEIAPAKVIGQDEDYVGDLFVGTGAAHGGEAAGGEYQGFFGNLPRHSAKIMKKAD